jgi:hypothetical protein
MYFVVVHPGTARNTSSKRPKKATLRATEGLLNFVRYMGITPRVIAL